MTKEFPSPTPIDGIASPEALKVDGHSDAKPVATQSSEALVKKRSKLAWILIASAMATHFCIALFFMASFPREDAGGNSMKMLGVGIMSVAIALAVIFIFASMTRIVALKQHTRQKLRALLRVFAASLPVLVISVVTMIMMNREPTFALQIVSPNQASPLIAPVSVTFGMQRALSIFEKLHLTPLEYQWDFTGDGIIDQKTFDSQATFIASRSGVYPVSAMVTMTDGTVKYVKLRLIVSRESFGNDPETPIIDEPVQFSIENLVPKGQGAPTLTKAKWDFDGDGIVDLETNAKTAMTTFRKLGPVNTSVTLTFSNQTQSSFQRSMTVVKTPEQPFPITLDAEPSTLLGPPPFGAVFTLKTKNAIANASWDFGDQKQGEGLRIAHVFSTVGTFTVTATVRSLSGSTARLSKVVRVTNPLQLPDLTFQGKPDVKSFMIEGEVPLTVDITPITSQPLISFSWDAQSASEVLATDKSFHAVYRDSGRYFLDLIAIDPDQNVFRKRIIVNAKAPKSVVSFTMDPPTPTAPATVTFDASDTFVPTGEQITGFVWDYGDGTAGDDSKFTGSRTTHEYREPGTYKVTLTVRTTSNQRYTGNQTLVVKAPIIDACFMPSRSTGKAPLGVFFDESCSSGNFTSRLWDFGDRTQSDQVSPSHVFDTPGLYTVTLVSVTADGRRSTRTATITVLAP